MNQIQKDASEDREFICMFSQLRDTKHNCKEIKVSLNQVPKIIHAFFKKNVKFL